MAINHSKINIIPCKIKCKDIDKSNHSLVIHDLEYVGSYHTSTNKIYTITWDENGGIFYLIRNNEIVLKGSAQHPYHSHVSNKGIFALADIETKLYYVISPNGEILIKTNLHANPGGVSVSDDGLYAVAQTYQCNNDSKAIIFFEEALRYNPKIGVKRLLSQLKKFRVII